MFDQADLGLWLRCSLFVHRFSIFCQVLHCTRQAWFLPVPTYSAKRKNLPCRKSQESPGLARQIELHFKPLSVVCFVFLLNLRPLLLWQRKNIRDNQKG